MEKYSILIIVYLWYFGRWYQDYFSIYTRILFFLSLIYCSVIIRIGSIPQWAQRISQTTNTTDSIHNFAGLNSLQVIFTNIHWNSVEMSGQGYISIESVYSIFSLQHHHANQNYILILWPPIIQTSVKLHWPKYNYSRTQLSKKSIFTIIL